MLFMLMLWLTWRPVSMALALGFSLASFSPQRMDKKATVKKPILTPEAVKTHLSKFPEAARQTLEAVLLDERFDGVIESQVVEETIRLAGGTLTREQLMTDMLPIARLYSTVPTSGFRVGAVCEGASGNIYFGANLELPGAPLGVTVHAEQSAIANAFSHGEKGVRLLAVTSAPCGHCRQFLNELATASTLQIMIAGKPKATLKALLPESFGPADLGVEGGLLGQTETPLIPLSDASDPLVAAALRAATRSYSPYTRSYSGVAVRLKNGRIISGAYMENAAYNPSLAPMLAAIDRLRFSGFQYSDISKTVLVQLERSKISQQEITRLILDTIAPGTELRVVKARIANK